METLFFTALLFVIAALWLINHRKQQAFIDSQVQDITEKAVSNATLGERVQHVEKQVAALEKKLIAKEEQLDVLNREIFDYKSNAVELETRLAEQNKAAHEKLMLLEGAKEKLGHEFKLLANQVFEERGKTFTAQNRASINEILQPMREQLGDFRKRVDQVHLDDAKDRASLKTHLTQLETLNRQMSEDALGLTQALKGESKAQGNWGEMILERILETSGLREGHEFLREDSTDTDEGRRLRPDVIIRMPGEKHIIIDSKVSLTDYERALATTDSETYKKVVKAHVNSLKNHIRSLSEKRYDQLPNIHSPDYVLMFVPIEGAYMMAIEADQGIFEAAFDKRVAVVTPSTLYATLKLVEQLWRYERQSDNVVKLIARASKLHDKMATFVESFEEVGSRINQAQKAYDTSMNRIKSGPGNVISQIDALGRLAGKTKKELPKQLTESAALSDRLE
ncbi:MAG: DNA recombination protein RmuC [Mariprofundaceae bacterium]